MRARAHQLVVELLGLLGCRACGANGAPGGLARTGGPAVSRGSANGGRAGKERGLLSTQALEGRGIHVLCEDGKLATAQLGVNEEARQRLPHKHIVLGPSLRLYEPDDLLRDARVQRAHGNVVGARDQHGVERRRGVDAVNHESLGLHLLGGLARKTLKGERGGVALGS